MRIDTRKYRAGVVTAEFKSILNAFVSFIRQLHPQKRKPTTCVSDWFSGAPENNEILNLWRDFLKVVDFIDDNHEWLNPLLAQTDKMKQ